MLDRNNCNIEYMQIVALNLNDLRKWYFANKHELITDFKICNSLGTCARNMREAGFLKHNHRKLSDNKFV